MSQRTTITASRAPETATPTQDAATRVLLVPTSLSRKDPERREHVLSATARDLVRTAPPNTHIIACGTGPEASQRARAYIARLGLPASISPHSGSPVVAYWMPEREVEQAVEDEGGRVTGTRTIPAHWAVVQVGRWPIAERSWAAIEEAIAEARGEAKR